MEIKVSQIDRCKMKEVTKIKRNSTNKLNTHTHTTHEYKQTNTQKSVIKKNKKKNL